MRLTILLLSISFAGGLEAQSEAQSYLKTHYMTPEEYVASKFATSDIVLLGEFHWVKHDPLFVQSMIPILQRRGVHNLAIEFARRVDQPLIDTLLTAPKYDEGLARRIIMQEFVHWGFKEYVDLFKVAWKVNRRLKPGETPFRILGINNAPDWSVMKTRADMTQENRLKALHGEGPKDYAQVIIDSVLHRGQKALVYSGNHHAFTHYEQPVVINGKFIRKDPDRMGHYLWEAAPTRVFLIVLHHPWPGITGYDSKRVLPAGGAIDRIVRTLGPKYKRVGFDLRATPLGKLQDSTSVYSRGYEPFTLDEFADGYVYLGPVSEFEPVTVIRDFVNEKNLEYARQHSSYPEFRSATARDFYETDLRDAELIRNLAKQKW
jgi:hypothetical protein